MQIRHIGVLMPDERLSPRLDRGIPPAAASQWGHETLIIPDGAQRHGSW
jgi:hypothetical protein